MSETQTITAPTDPDAYARWLAGKTAALAHTIQAREDVTLGDMEREMLRDAARAMLAALDA